MQKWIRDRMRRRKKKTGTDGSPANEQNPPLQPAYPESSDSGADESEEIAVNDGVSSSQTPADEASAGGRASAGSRTSAKKTSKKSPRRRKKKSEPPVTEAAADQVSQQDGPSSAPLTPRGSDHEEAAAPAELPEPSPVVVAETAENLPPAVEPAPAPVAQPVSTQAPTAKKTQRASKGAVILAVGLPGSGKSTWFNRHGVSPLSSDKIRDLLFDNPTEQRHQDLVFGTLRSLLRARLIARMPMNYVDATNLSPKERRHWIKMAKDFGYEAQAVYFDVPLEVCMERNRRRNRIVPEDVMHRMGAKLRPPTFDEGFSKIVVVRVKQKAAEKATAGSGDVPGHSESAAEAE